MINMMWENRARDGGDKQSGHFAIACGLMAVASAIRDLGNANAATPMGALEAHGLAIKEAADTILSGLVVISDSIDGLIGQDQRKE